MTNGWSFVVAALTVMLGAVAGFGITALLLASDPSFQYLVDDLDGQPPERDQALAHVKSLLAGTVAGSVLAPAIATAIVYGRPVLSRTLADYRARRARARAEAGALEQAARAEVAAQAEAARAEAAKRAQEREEQRLLAQAFPEESPAEPSATSTPPRFWTDVLKLTLGVAFGIILAGIILAVLWLVLLGLFLNKVF